MNYRDTKQEKAQVKATDWEFGEGGVVHMPSECILYRELDISNLLKAKQSTS